MVLSVNDAAKAVRTTRRKPLSRLHSLCTMAGFLLVGTALGFFQSWCLFGTSSSHHRDNNEWQHQHRSTTTKRQYEDNHNHDDNTCTIYLAPSSLPDADNRPAGFGVFTTKFLPKGSYTFPRGEGPSMVLTDLKANNRGTGLGWLSQIFVEPCLGFNYDADSPNYGNDSDVLASVAANVNSGAMGNYHPYLLNALFDDTEIYRDNLLDRYQDPGAGAFSYHMGKKWHVTRDVAAGEEIFNDYGERWFLDQKLGAQGQTTIPHAKDYVRVAAKIVQELVVVNNKTLRRTRPSPKRSSTRFGNECAVK